MTPGLVCSVHRSHSPRNLTVELHHVLPVAWQTRTPVDVPPYPGPDTEGRGMLWDDRTTALCPTGHRNTHFWIVQLMHAARDAATEDPMVAYARLRKPRGPTPGELPVALAALQRFVPYGQLAALIAAGEWGES